MEVMFVESRSFSRRWQKYLTEDELRDFQNYLMKFPDAGDIIKNSGGLRKIRWKLKGSGKRGGLRIIYFLRVPEQYIFLLTIYSKNEMEDLTQEEYRLLKKVVERW
jgi:mRNA-degrading endonuclease RelE of RelBE toxin-antitoxin system